ncbi:hypothetical protein BDF22DRAFT_676042 [Syncephalis plumigaleata]|nr:hypothetical protein BDF22DRAFT_676042 [Syncephalis plumigaleata]
MLTPHQIVLGTLIVVYGWRASNSMRDLELLGLLLKETEKAREEQYTSTTLWRQFKQIANGQKVTSQLASLNSPFELDQLVEAMCKLLTASPSRNIETFGGTPQQHPRSVLGSYIMYLTTEYRQLKLHGVNKLLQMKAKHATKSDISHEGPTNILYHLERRDYYGAARTLYRFFDYDNWKLGSWYATAALNVALCQTDGTALLEVSNRYELIDHHTNLKGNRAKRLLASFPEADVDYLYPSRAHMAGFDVSMREHGLPDDSHSHKRNLNYWLRNYIKNSPKNSTWEHLITQCIQLYSSFYEIADYSCIERQSIIPLTVNQMALERGRLNECIQPNSINYQYLQSPNAQRVWQTQVAKCFQKAGALEMTLGRQIDHQVSAYVGNMPATLLGTSLSICLTLDLMGLTEIATEMAQDIANEAHLRLSNLDDADDHDLSSSSSKRNATLIAVSELLDRAQKVFTEIDDRDMLIETLLYLCTTYNARGLHEERNEVAKRLQQLVGDDDC